MPTVSVKVACAGTESVLTSDQSVAPAIKTMIVEATCVGMESVPSNTPSAELVTTTVIVAAVLALVLLTVVSIYSRLERPAVIAASAGQGCIATSTTIRNASLSEVSRPIATPTATVDRDSVTSLFVLGVCVEQKHAFRRMALSEIIV